MIVKYKVSGTIEIDLDKYEIDGLNEHTTETMKKNYLEELLYTRLHTCEITCDHELEKKIDFEDLYVDSDWNKYAGNMKTKNELHGSPLAISIEDIPTTYIESVNSTLKEIGNRKKNKKR